MGHSPVYVFIGRVAINFITLLVRVLYLRPLIQLPARKYVVQVFVPIALVSLISLPLPLWMHYTMQSAWSSFILNSIVCLLVSSVSIFVLGLSKGEKQMAYNMVIKKVFKK